MTEYSFLQHYWWFIVSLLGALLVFLLFVQGGNSLVYSLGRNEEERRMIMNSTGRKWEFTFTTLVTFGGAFFASFPLFYSTSFGGAYWLWMIILFSFVLQAVSYEFQSKEGNLLGKKAYRAFLIANGIIGPLLLGGAVATFFTGSDFIINKGNMSNELMPVISQWGNGWHGLDALTNPWVWVLGLAVFFLARVLGILYIMNNVADENLRSRGSVQLVGNAAFFVLLFVIFLLYVVLKDGFAVDPTKCVLSMEHYIYLHNPIHMWYVLTGLLAGVALVLYGIVRTIVSKSYVQGIWPVGIGVVITVLCLLLCAGWNNTAYYPSTTDLQSSLSIANSSSSLFTLRTMAYVSVLVPFVLAYIVYAWHTIDRKKIDAQEMQQEEHLY